MKLKLLIVFLGGLYLPSGMALTLNGFTGFASVIELNARVTGVVKSINVIKGQRVAKGEVLLELDNIPHRARLDRAIAIEKSLYPVQQTALLELERAEELYDRDSLSQVSLKNAENAVAESSGKYQAAIADRVFAEYQLDNTVIRSPVNARVLQVHTNKAQYQDPSVNKDPLITLVESQQMMAIALINSEQWHSSLIDKTATVTYRDKKFTGKVSSLGYKRIKQSGRLPAYQIQVIFSTDVLIPAEMPVTINIKD